MTTNDEATRNLVRAAVETIGAAPIGTPDEVLLPKLQAKGIPRDEARLLLVFLPTAFGRIVLSRMGVARFSDHAHVVPTGGKPFDIYLSSQPLYVIASEIAASAHKLGYGKDVFGAIAARSAEVSAVVRAEKQGSKIQGGTIESPILQGFDERLFVSFSLGQRLRHLLTRK